MNGRELPAPLPQMPANGCMGSPDAQQMRPEGDPFHAGPPPPLNIDDKNGDRLHPLHSLGLCLVGSMVDSLCLWKSSVLMLNAMKPCLQSVLVQQAMSPFIILRLRLRLRCQSARCSNSRPMVGHIIMVTWCSSAPIIAKSFWLSFSCGLVVSGEALGPGRFGLSAGIDPTYRGPASLEAVSESSESAAQVALQGLTCD